VVLMPAAEELCFLVVCIAVLPLSIVYTLALLRDAMSLLSGHISVKLITNIFHVTGTGNC